MNKEIELMVSAGERKCAAREEIAMTESLAGHSASMTAQAIKLAYEIKAYIHLIPEPLRPFTYRAESRYAGMRIWIDAKAENLAPIYGDFQLVDGDAQVSEIGVALAKFHRNTAKFDYRPGEQDIVGTDWDDAVYAASKSFENFTLLQAHEESNREAERKAKYTSERLAHFTSDEYLLSLIEAADAAGDLPAKATAILALKGR